MRLALAVTLLWLSTTVHTCFGQDNDFRSNSLPKSNEAYATLVYGDEFVLGARVLGQSLRESGTARDMVALCTGTFSSSSELTLHTDGWRVMHVSPLQNPGRGPQKTGFPPRFWGVYTKLLIFKLTEYRKVVFIDSDVLVLRNMDAIFRCPGFCASLRHSERFNTGVMSLEPSVETFNEIMTNIAKLPSYTGGDQGFLNSFFSGFAHAPLFDPDTNYTPDQYKYMRLPTTFNADVGLYVVGSNRWMIPRETLYVIHYTLGPFKPWVWWSTWLVRENPAWQAVRYRLPPDAHGNAHGRTNRQLFAERWLLLLPWAMLAAAAYFTLPPGSLSLKVLASQLGSAGSIAGRSLMASLRGGLGGLSGGAGAAGLKQHSMGMSGAEALLKLQQVSIGTGGGGGGGVGSGGGAGECFPRAFVPLSVAAGYACVLVATVITILLVPPEVGYVYGWVLSYEWGFLLMAVLYGWYLSLCFKWGRQAGPHASLLHIKSERRPWVETATAAVTFAASLLMAPFLGRMLAINSFVGNIVATVFVGLGVILITTLQFVFLPVQWYVAGRLAATRFE